MKKQQSKKISDRFQLPEALHKKYLPEKGLFGLFSLFFLHFYSIFCYLSKKIRPKMPEHLASTKEY